MTNPTNTEAAPKRSRKTSPPPPPLDFGNIKPVAAEPPSRRHGRPSVDNPALPWLRDSWAQRDPNTNVGAGRKIEIPEANLQQVRNFLNYAARDIGCGVSIRTEPSKAKGKVAVMFAAKPRKQKRQPPAQ